MLNLIKKSVFVNFLTLIILISVGFYFPQNVSTVSAADSNFALTWSSNSYVPPGYAGLAIPTRGCQIKVFALPTKKLGTDPAKLTYRWLLDDEIISGAGGQGKSVFTFRSNKWPGDYHTVESQILNGGAVVWRGFVEIKISNSETIFKIPNDDYSIVDVFSTGTGQTLKILAIPFFFNTKDPASLNFQWRLDGQNLVSTDSKDLNTFSLTIPSGKLQEALIKNLGLTISDATNSDLRASSQITLEIK